MISTWTCRGTKTPTFQGLDLVFGPEVEVDLQGDDPPRAAREATVSALVTQTLAQKPS